ncbi:MAG: InlB B-repeat-containing protein [Clostridia bacterium]|nr:InlB B-repeat-containing protein [Clostridia bacterium]
MKKVEKVISIFAIVLMLLSFVPNSIAVNENYTYSDEDEFVLDDIPDENQIDAFGTISYEPIQTPQYAPDMSDIVFEEDMDGGISTFAVKVPGETIDQTATLNPLSGTNCENDTGNYVNDTIASSRGFENILSMTRDAFMTVLANNGFEAKTKGYLNAVLQGGCTDGTNMYYAYLVYDGSGDEKIQLGVCIVTGHFVITKVEATDENGETIKIKQSEFIVDNYRFGNDKVNPELKELNHMNGMTYNSLENTIVFSCRSTKRSEPLCVINANYFTQDGVELKMDFYDVSCRFSSIAYNETLNRYIVNVAGQVYYFCILDSNFNIVGVIKNETYGDTVNIGTVDNGSDDEVKNVSLAGLTCDDNYIYAAYYLQGISDFKEPVQNVVAILDWSGNMVKEINLSIDRTAALSNQITYEIENISIMGKKILLGFNCLYKKTSETKRLVRSYHYDLSNEFFNIQYCEDEDVDKHLEATTKKTSNVLEGTSTRTLINTFKKPGYKFVGWNLYSPASKRWFCELKSGGSRGWCSQAFLEDNDDYVKVVYGNGQRVSETVSKNGTVLFCAVWEESKNEYRISFDSNGGSGTIEPTKGSTISGFTMPANSFTKSANGTVFQGWMVYDVQQAKWLFYNVEGSDVRWAKDGEASTGYQKKIYSPGETFNITVDEGTDLVLFAVWNEFIIYYDSNGAKITANNIKAPSIAVTNGNNTIRTFSSSDIYTSATSANFLGYNQHRIEIDKWRYASPSGSDVRWLYPKVKEESYPTYDLYLFEGSTVSQTCPSGRSVVFIAVWDKELSGEV